MKKFIITSIFSSLVCVASFGQSLYRTILSHYDSSTGQTTLTQYDINHWSDAITNAVDGDIVYFTPGYFPGGCTITKDITLIGAGEVEVQTGTDQTSGAPIMETQRTRIGGEVYVDIEGESTPTLSTWLLDGLYINNKLRISKSVNNLKIKRCSIDVLEAVSTDVTCNNAELQSCIFDHLYCNLWGEGDYRPYIHNCYIRTLSVQEKLLTFENCSIESTDYASGCNFRNCCLRSDYNVGANTYYYCVYYEDHSDIGSTYTGCYHRDSYGEWGGTLTAEQLVSEGYYQDDGTTVTGHLGGPTPYTLIPSQPYVSASTVTYNATDKKLNVNITVKKGK